jgi:Plant transposon protein
MSETSTREICQAFTKLVVREFGSEYLNRYPTPAERKNISSVMATKGFPGCLGSWDCKHFVWKNCPSRQSGQHKGHHDGGKKRSSWKLSRTIVAIYGVPILEMQVL